jgi:rare lipoprotein A
MRRMVTWIAIVGFVTICLAANPGEVCGAGLKTKQVGLASWYGKPHQGRKTASGERFSRSQMTAAHRSLPLGTKVQVTNLRTGQDVIVRINDRGPHAGGKRRIIDLSEAAAKRIGLAPRGVELVQVVVLKDASEVFHPLFQG